VYQPDSGCDHGARRQAVTRQLDRLGEDPADIEDDRTDPQCLLRDRIEELVAGRIARRAGFGGPHRLVQDGGVSGQPLQRPREPSRRRVVPGDKERHELIAKFGVGHATAVYSILTAGTDQHRQRVAARREVGIGAAVGDLGVQQVIGFLDVAAQCPPRP
jgi:hypothetical protein